MAGWSRSEVEYVSESVHWFEWGNTLMYFGAGGGRQLN